MTTHLFRTVLCLSLLTATASGQDASAPPAEPTIRDIQSSIGARYRRFEKTLQQLRDYMEQTDPTRADLLTRVTSRGRESRINDQLEMILDLLDRPVPQYANIVDRQDDLIKSLSALLDLLQSEDERKRIAEEIKRIEEILGDLNQLVVREKGVRSGTERGKPLDELEEKQKDIKDDARELADKIDEQDQAAQEEAGDQKESNSADSPKPQAGSPSEAKPQESSESENSPQENQQNSPPAESQPSPSSPSEQRPQNSSPSQQSPPQQTPGREQLEKAIQKMQQAIDELKDQNRDQASEEQDRVIAELEKAKAELEERLRQLREEELKILLASLESRFRRVLLMQLEVRKGTVSLEQVPEDQRLPRHRARSRQLSRDEAAIITEVDQALILLREEGSSIAFPEAVLAMREDMEIVVRRLDEFQVNKLTIRIENDIIEALQEMIEALRQQLEEMEQQQGQPQQQGEQQDPALINQLAELKILRAMQLRINRRTTSYHEAISEADNLDTEMLNLLQQLSDRQARVQRAAYDLATGKNQ